MVAFDKEGDHSEGEIAGLLSKLSIPGTKQNVEIVRFFTKEHLPLTREVLLKVAGWLTCEASLEKSLETLKFLLLKGFPLTKDTLTALQMARHGQPLVSPDGSSCFFKSLFHRLQWRNYDAMEREKEG